MAKAVYGSLPFREQAEFFRRKLNLPTDAWTDVYTQEHDWAFMVAGASLDAIVADFRAAVDKAITGGSTLEDFRKDFDAIVAKHGWDYNGGRNWRSRVIYETNLATSFAAGRWEQLQSAPYWQYEHSDWVAHPRAQHVAWDGMVLAKDDPVWQVIFPPNGWGCQCKVKGLWARDLAQLGKTGPDPSPQLNWQEQVIGKNSPNGPRMVSVPEGIDPGFEYAPGSSLQRQTAQQSMARKSANPASAGPSSEQQSWHDAAFGNAPPWLQRQVEQRGVLKGGVSANRDEASLYFIANDRLNINPLTHGDKSSALGQGLWRHEFGHAMDHALQGDGFPRSSEPDFGKAMRADALDLIALGARGAAVDKAQATLANLRNTDLQSALAMSTAPSPVQWLQERFSGLGLELAQVQQAMQTHTRFAVVLTDADLYDRYRRIIIALEMRDAEGLLAALTGGMETARYAERSFTYSKGNLGSLSDLFGSMTRNQVAGIRSGFGHSDAYYDADPSALPQSEVFANLTSLFGDGNPVWAQILEIMTPRLAQLFKEIMQ